MEKEYVQSGVITNLLKSLPKFIGKGIEQVSKMGVNVTESKPVDGNYDNGVIFVATGGKGHTIKCKVVPVPELKGRFNFYIKSKDGHQASWPSIKEDQMDDKITEFFDKFYGESFEDAEDNKDDFNMDEFSKEDESKNESPEAPPEEQDMNSSKQLFVKLSRVTAGENISAKVHSVFANYASVPAMADMTCLLADNDFIQSIPEEPTAYCVTSTPEELTTEALTNEKAEGTQPLDPMDCVMQQIYVSLMNLHYLGMRTCTPMMYNYLDGMSIANDIMYSVRRLISIFVASGWEPKNPISFLQNGECVSVLSTDADSVQSDVKSCLENIVCTLSLYRPDFSPDIQSVFDDIVSTLKIQYLSIM